MASVEAISDAMPRVSNMPIAPLDTATSHRHGVCGQNLWSRLRNQCRAQQVLAAREQLLRDGYGFGYGPYVPQDQRTHHAVVDRQHVNYFDGSRLDHLIGGVNVSSVAARLDQPQGTGGKVAAGADWKIDEMEGRRDRVGLEGRSPRVLPRRGPLLRRFAARQPHR